MGIKTRMYLGRGSGGGGVLPSAQITSDAGATVTMTLGTDVRTITASAEGIALFENLTYGTWDVETTLDGATSTDSINIVSQFDLNLPVGIRLNDLPLRSKLKIDNQKFILMAKNHSGYPDNSGTLILESIYSNMAFGSNTVYETSNVRSWLSSTFMGLFSEKNQAKFLDTTFGTYSYSTSAYYDLTDKFFLLSATEVGLATTTQEGSNIGFTSNSDRIAYLNGSAVYWWLRTPYSTSYVRDAGTDGTLDNYDPSYSHGVRPACNLSLQEIFTANPDSEGYYVIK